MRLKLLACGVAAAAAVVATGCVSTASGGKAAGVPFINDQFQSLYKMPPGVVFQAAKDVLKSDGVVTNEGTNYDGTNEVQFVQARVNECRVWVSVSVASPGTTQAVVQVRRGSGGTDLVLANQIDKEIAVRMSRE